MLAPRAPSWVLAPAWAVVVLLWLVDAAGHGLPDGLDRVAVGAALLATLAVIARSAVRWSRERWAARVLLAIVILSALLCFVGLDHELTGRDFGDEGIYRAHAERINGEGQILRPWFVYPHLLFYLDAVALWIAGLFQPVVAALARLFYGVRDPLALSVLVTRTVTATLGALLPIPVFVTARRVAGDVAAVAAALLSALSPLAVDVAHLNLSDGAAAFFAALALMQASALLDRETTRDYVLAGIWAGLAAGAKYPAGVVAVAIVALWVRWRLRERRLGWGLVWAGAASLLAFLATTPSLIAFPHAAFGTETDVLFGFRQYAHRGWTGVVRASNSRYYGGQLAANYGLPALALGLAGLAGLRRRELGRLAWLLPFAAVDLALLLSLEMAVPRNLLAVLPLGSVALGCGAAGGWRLLARLGRARAPVAAAAVVAFLALPAFATVAEVVRLARPTSREEAAAWIDRNLPPGSFVVQEAYTPRLEPEWRFPTRRPRFAIRIPREELESREYDFLFLAAGSYNRFLRAENLDDPALEAFAERYRRIFARYPLVREWSPGRFQDGTELRLYRLDPEPVRWRDRRVFGPGDALLRSPEMAPGAEGGAIRYTAADQWSLFKEYLAPGRYRLRVATDAPEGRIEVRDRANRVLAEVPWRAGAPVELDVPEPEKLFLYVHLPAGSRLDRLAVRSFNSRSPGP
jgi:4-amino-4-deoxy-L-arabinose transferase-like glycosyltransferase